MTENTWQEHIFSYAVGKEKQTKNHSYEQQSQLWAYLWNQLLYRLQSWVNINILQWKFYNYMSNNNITTKYSYLCPCRFLQLCLHQNLILRNRLLRKPVQDPLPIKEEDLICIDWDDVSPSVLNQDSLFSPHRHFTFNLLTNLKANFSGNCCILTETLLREHFT